MVNLSPKIESPKEWVEQAISKGYSAMDLRDVLIKHGYKSEQILKVLGMYEKISDSKTHDFLQTKMITPPKPITLEKSHTYEKEHKKEEPKYKGKLIEEYSLTVDGAKVKVSIEKLEEGFFYNLTVPPIKIGTEALLDEIRKDLITLTGVGVGEIIDEKSIYRIKSRFIKDASKLIQEKIPRVKKDTEEFLTGILSQEMLGLGKIEFLINDPLLEEIVIVNSNEIRVYQKKHGWLLTNVVLKSEDEVTNYANIIARRVGRQISVLTPLLDAHVVTGDRSNAVLYPIATKGNTITIRKFSRDPWTIIDLIGNKTVSKEIAALLWLAIEYEMNILFSGGTASGKTVFLNACMPFMPPNQRIISMEDTRELMLPKFLYWCPLVTRTPNAEGKGEVSMLDLLVNSLRMRPDRIILGEMRRQREAEVLFEAMHTGHSVLSTLHADTGTQTVRRLTTPPISLPPSDLDAIHLILVQYRDRRKNIRRTLEICEIAPGAKEEEISTSTIYRWRPRTDSFELVGEPTKYLKELNLHTGMTKEEIFADIKNRATILRWMIANKMTDIEAVGRLMALYYSKPKEVLDIAKKSVAAKEEKK